MYRTERTPEPKFTNKNDEMAKQVIKPIQAWPRAQYRAAPLADINCTPPKATAPMAASAWLGIGITS